MEPYNNKGHSSWYQAYWGVYVLTPYSEAWHLAEGRLWNRFDRPFVDKDK